MLTDAGVIESSGVRPRLPPLPSKPLGMLSYKEMRQYYEDAWVRYVTPLPTQRDGKVGAAGMPPELAGLDVSVLTPRVQSVEVKQRMQLMPAPVIESLIVHFWKGVDDHKCYLQRPRGSWLRRLRRGAGGSDRCSTRPTQGCHWGCHTKGARGSPLMPRPGARGHARQLCSSLAPRSRARAGC